MLCCPCSCCCRCPAKPVCETQFDIAGTKFVTLPDGRKLEYLVGGDPDGVAVLCVSIQFGSCFGYAGPLFDSAAQKGIKIVSITVPGFGLSDGYPLGVDRSVSAFPGDVALIVKAEKLNFFHIHSVSAGSVYAAMIAITFPDSMVGNVCISAPPTDPGAPGMKELGSKGESPMVKIMKGLASAPFAGDCLGYIFGRCMKPENIMGVAPDTKSAMQFLKDEGPPRGDAVLKALLDDVKHSFTHTYRGAMDNNYPVIWEKHYKWVPDFSEFVAKGHAFGITSAADDRVNPQAMQQWWHKQIKGSIWMEYPATGWGHCHTAMPGGADRIWDFIKTGQDPGMPGSIRVYTGVPPE